MREKPRVRKRAVRLTDSALEALDQAVTTKWEASGRAGRLTREARAELLGVSVPTSERILSGTGVDRTTLQLVHTSVGLAWSNQLCVPAVADLGDEPASTPQSGDDRPEIPADDSPTTIASKQPDSPKPPTKRAPIYLGAVIVATIAILSVPRSSEAIPRSWVNDFNDTFNAGQQFYEDGEYARAEKKLAEALELARRHDSAGKIAISCKLDGDIKMARGLYEEAEASYDHSYRNRELLDQGICLPPRLVSLGIAQTKLHKFGSAKENLTAGLNGFEGYTHLAGVSEACREIGTLYFVLNDEATSMHWYERALTAIKDLRKPDMVIDIQSRQAQVLQRLGRYGEARTILRKCLAYWESKKHPHWIPETQFMLGSCEAASGNWTVAGPLLQASRVGFQRVGDQAGARRAALAVENLSSQ